MKKITIIAAFFAFALYTFLSQPYTHPASAAVACVTQNPSPRNITGLISAPDITNFGNPTGQCVVGSKAAFAPYKLPTYEDLKSMYFTQSRITPISITPASGTANQGQLRTALNNGDLILVSGNLEINNLGGSAKTAVVFVEGNLSFSEHDFAFGDNNIGDNNNGIVFVVRGNVSVDATPPNIVKQINAVIISSGTIRTADSTCTRNSVPVEARTNALTVKGALISLESGSIVFCRTLTDNRYPAEIINHDPKYLVILRDLFADTRQEWSEIQ